MRPLDGVRILSFAQLGQGPSAVQLLTDFGAEAIKVERPGRGAFERGYSGANAFRGGQSVFFLTHNRNQRGLTLDLKDPRGRQIAWELARRADVLVENYRPGVMDRLGLGYDTLAELNPRLVYGSSTGYGSDGPYRDRPGQDLLIQALSGLAAMTGREQDPPVPAGSPIVDYHAGALLALGVVMALMARERSGRGQRVELNLLLAALHLQQEPLTYQANGWDVTRRSRSGLASTYHQAPYGIYRTSDGYLALSLNPLPALAEALPLAALAGYTERDAIECRDEIREAVEAVTVTRSTDEWLRRLAERDIWCGPVKGYGELLADPQIRHLAPFEELEVPGVGGVQVLRAPIQLHGTPARITSPPPALGEHTDAILAELGYIRAEIAALRAEGVV